ncbi:hypothetical protein ACMT9U_13585 [Clavibacter sp. Sh2036]
MVVLAADAASVGEATETPEGHDGGERQGGGQAAGDAADLR